jgi:ubiquinone/menaquinone biosynthesis C-methylase UbiE
MRRRLQDVHRIAIHSLTPEISFKDHFSGHAGSYAEFRPGYPETLFAYLAAQCAGQDLAWDCATGNGQAARSLAPYFSRIIATDASEEQVASASPHTQIDFRVARAESSGLETASVNLVTVAQALHWFNIDRFFTEALRVLKPGGVLAVWCYEHCHVDAACDETIEKVFTETDAYWPPERKIVDDRYQGITFPVAELPAEAFSMSAFWTANDMLGYMRTWSASQRYLAASGKESTAPWTDELQQRWGSGAREVKWPITLRVGKNLH